MARPKNAAYREAILASATRTFAAEGLGASTASIAKQAGVSTGTLFVYFENKSALINELYVKLKSEMGLTASAAAESTASPRDQLHSMWDRWMLWATEGPDRRLALAHLSIADDLTEDSHHAVHRAYAGIAELLVRVTDGGPLKGAPMSFITTLMSAIADATIDDLIADPDPSGARSTLAFDAMWRALAG